MKIQQKGMNNLLRHAAVGVLLAGGAMTAHAETVATTLFQSTTMVTSANINLTELDLTTPGTLSVSLTDLDWPSALNALSFTLFDATHVVGTQGSGTWTFDIASPSTLFASVFAAPDSSAKAGLYNVQISYLATAAPVPLPATAWFLLSGVAGLAALRPKQKLSQMYA